VDEERESGREWDADYPIIAPQPEPVNRFV